MPGAGLEGAEYAAREFETALPGGGRGAARYLHDPVGFVRDCVAWPPDRALFAYQLDIIGHVATHHRVAVRGPRGLGKTAISALLILWFAVTRDAAGIDWKIGTTAGSFVQISQFTWPEVHKWARLLRWDVLERKPFNTRTELLTMHIRLRHGEAFAASVDNPFLIEGAHADHVLFVLDESKAIAASVFDSIEGTFSNAGTGGREAYTLSISTPGPPAGFFYDIHARVPGTEDWWPRHVTKDEAISAGAISAAWCDQRRRRWGEDSALYHNHVLGEFYSADEDGVIPLSWIEQATARHLAWRAAGAVAPEGRRYLGVDVARSGADDTVMALRTGPVITEIRRSRREDTMQTAGRIMGIVAGAPDTTPVIDVIGIGAGVVDRVREQGVAAEAFNAAAGTRRRDATGEMGFVSTRAAAWWNLREMLAPYAGHDIALPDDDLLIGDLAAPRYRVMSGGKIQVEGKDEIRRRIGRSTDTGDAVVQAFWPLESSWRTAYAIVTCRHCARPYMGDRHPDRCPMCRRSQEG